MTKKLYSRLGRHALPADVMAECSRISAIPQVHDYELLRIYWYDAPPSSERVTHPVSGTSLHLATTPRFRQSQSFYDQLILEPHVALRMGHVMLTPNKWRPNRVLREISSGQALAPERTPISISIFPKRASTFG